MLSDITSDQHDSTQCRYCGVTLATRLPSCPSCGANQLDPLGWYPPAAGLANARLAPPPASHAEQLAAPATWNTPAGAEEDRFYAKHEPWRAPRSYRWAWIVGGLAVALLALALAGYFALRPGTQVRAVAPKAVFGAVTAQRAAPTVAASAGSSVSAANAAARTPHSPTPASSVAAAKPPVSAPPVPSPSVSRPSVSTPSVTHLTTPAAPLAVQSARPTPTPPVARHETKSAPEPERPDVLANLQIARALLQRNDLSAAGARLAAVLAVQPRNRDALAMRADLSDRQQQRDTALDAARGCENNGRWVCAWHNAGNALVLDSSSADAKRIIARAMYEEQIDKAQAAPLPTVEPPPAGLYHH